LKQNHYSFSYEISGPRGTSGDCEPRQMKPGYIAIEPGSVITVKGIEEQSGFVDVSYRGQIVKVFLRDY
jgi:hypothetical protein